MSEGTPKTPEWSKSLSRELEDVINRQNLLTSRTRRRVLMSLQETSKSEENEEMKKLRKKAIDEIINSEKSYLKHLEIVEEFFMNPIQESGFLPQQVFAAIFGDILGIRQVNKELLTAMESSTEEIGKVFLELAPYLKFYSTYANDFAKATKLVEEWTEKHKGFRSLLGAQESRPEVQKKLNALLITPVQRIPRYKLLLDDVIKNTPKLHPDKNNLEEARTQIDAIAWHINDQIKDHENNMMMVAIQKSLIGGVPKIIKPGRKLIRQGNLMKVSKSGGHAQPRFVVLCSDMLMYCKLKGHLLSTGQFDLPKPDTLEMCCVLPLKHTKVEQVVGKGVFTITCQKEQLILYSNNAQDADWVDDIRKAAVQLKKNSASLKRESSRFEPMRRTDMIKMRRESLSKIMLSRKTEESKRVQLKANTKTSDSPLAAVARALSPRKRKNGPNSSQNNHSDSPNKLSKIVESPKSFQSHSESQVKEVDSMPVSPAVVTPGQRRRRYQERNSSTPIGRPSPASSPIVLRQSPRLQKSPTGGQQSDLAKFKAPKSVEESSASPHLRAQNPPSSRISTREKENEAAIDVPDSSVELRRKKPAARTEFKRQPRNSLRSLSLHRASKVPQAGRQTDEQTSAEKSRTIFRSPSIYDDPRPLPLGESEDTMRSFLTGRIVPLTPSMRPANVEHLAKRPAQQQEVEAEHEKVDHPIAVPDKRSYCTIS